MAHSIADTECDVERQGRSQKFVLGTYKTLIRIVE